MTVFECLLSVYVDGCLFIYLCILLVYFLFLIYLFLLCQKSKNHIKIRKSKSLIDIVEFCLRTCFALYLCANGFVLFRALLVFMHLYHCGKNLEIFVIVVNRSSNLSWMISERLWWSWDMHRLVFIYLPTLYFCFY